MEYLQDYIASHRTDFTKHVLDESGVTADPIQQFAEWFREAINAKLNLPNAMILSTANAKGIPSGRVMLLRFFNSDGFGFYTNYRSRKGLDIEQNNHAALTFFWPELERQIRIEGELFKQSPEESDRYFNSRPEASKIGAWVSPQSMPIAGRIELESNYSMASNHLEGQEITRPDFWGGYILKPNLVEFWQGRSNRLHDRIVYTKEATDNWKISRLAP